jgi:polar amino acid transport system substrate-binding protein
MKYIVLVIVLIGMQGLFAKEITVISESWDGATNHDGSGLYWDIVESVYAPLGYTVVKKHASYAKSVEAVRMGQADLWLGSYKDEKTFALYPKYHFDQAVILAVFHSELFEQWKGQKSLEGLKVAWMRGYDYGKYLSANVVSQEVNQLANGLKLLKSERIDIFIDNKKDLIEPMQRYRLDNDNYMKKIILQLKLYPAFSNTKKGKALRKIWDERMKELIETTAFKELYFNSEYTLFPY